MVIRITPKEPHRGGLAFLCRSTNRATIGHTWNPGLHVTKHKRTCKSAQKGRRPGPLEEWGERGRWGVQDALFTSTAPLRGRRWRDGRVASSTHCRVTRTYGQPPNTKHRTPNTKHQTPNIKHQTPKPNTEHQTPNIEHPTPNTQYRKPKNKCQIPNTEKPIPKTEYIVPRT